MPVLPFSSFMMEARQASTTMPPSTSSSASPAFGGGSGGNGFRFPGPSRNPVDAGPQMLAIIWPLAGLATGFFLLRIYCKFIRRRSIWYDDYVGTLATICLITACAFTTVAAQHGYGRRLRDISQEDVRDLPLYSNIAGTFSILAALWSKTAFAVMVLRITKSWRKWSIWFMILSLNLVMGAAAMTEWISCMPLQKSYKPWVRGTCWNKTMVRHFFQFTAAYSGTMDIILALFPWTIIWGMMMNKKEKLGVLIAMSMGIFAGATSLVKVAMLNNLGIPDPSETVQLVIWGIAESAITIVAASIPILRALIQDRDEKGRAALDIKTITVDETNATRFTASRRSRNVSNATNEI